MLAFDFYVQDRSWDLGLGWHLTESFCARRFQCCHLHQDRLAHY